MSFFILGGVGRKNKVDGKYNQQESYGSYVGAEDNIPFDEALQFGYHTPNSTGDGFQSYVITYCAKHQPHTDNLVTIDEFIAYLLKQKEEIEKDFPNGEACILVRASPELLFPGINNTCKKEEPPSE